MQTTNKKFADKKNISNNQESLFKSFAQKNQKKIVHSQNCEDKTYEIHEHCHSKAYQPQDNYSDILKVFKAGKFDFAYQNFQNAFPFGMINYNQQMYHEVKLELNLNDFPISSQESKIREKVQYSYESSKIPEQKIQLFQEQTQSDSQQIYEQQQSTKQNSSRSK